MLKFKSPELSDRQWVSEILLNSNVQSCELSFGNLFMWSIVYHNHIAKYDNFIIIKNIYDEFNTYSFPVGDGDLKAAITEIINDSINDGKQCKFYGLTDDYLSQLKEIFSDKFDFVENRDLCDYVYLCEKMATLSGKKLHSKRNHITNFKKEFPNWKFENINNENIPECIQMHEKWIQENGESEDYLNEFKVVKCAFDNFSNLNYVGGLLRVDGEVVAFTFGEQLNNDTFCTHIEKAFSSMRGAYPIINQLFTQNCLMNYTYVNREEDLGIEGLRKAKLSYHPAFLVNRTAAIYRG